MHRMFSLRKFLFEYKLCTQSLKSMIFSPTHLCGSITCGYFSLENHLCSWLYIHHLKRELHQIDGIKYLKGDKKDKKTEREMLKSCTGKELRKTDSPTATLYRIFNRCNAFFSF